MGLISSRRQFRTTNSVEVSAWRHDFTGLGAAMWGVFNPPGEEDAKSGCVYGPWAGWKGRACAVACVGGGTLTRWSDGVLGVSGWVLGCGVRVLAPLV